MLDMSLDIKTVTAILGLTHLHGLAVWRDYEI